MKDIHPANVLNLAPQTAVTAGLILIWATASFADQTSYTKTETSSTSNSTVGGSSSSTETKLRTEKPSIAFTPKFNRRIMNLGEQIDLALSKGFISSEEAASFKQRQMQLVSMDEEATKKKMPQTSVIEIERALTVLNADMYRAMHKDTAAKETKEKDESTGATAAKSDIVEDKDKAESSKKAAEVPATESGK